MLLKLYRAGLISAAIVACLGSVSAQANSTTNTATGTRPNIILLLADDMDYADVGIYGGRLTPTPNIDSIAKSGMEFTNAYVSCPVCGPSRVGILT